MNGSPPDAAWTRVPALRGRHVALEPLESGHAAALRQALGEGELSRLWYANVPAPDAVEGYVAAALDARAQGTALPFVVRDVAGEVVGSTRFYALDAGVPRLNIGYTWYHRRVQRTGLNTEAKWLLLRHAFEAMGCSAVGFETSWFNHASRAAIARLGAKQDGVLRNHKRHADGTLRDTVVFSLLDNEWPAVRSHLQSLLDSHS
ncbi:GNAT family N-acetyltransferase [Stenotrophomonas mori]|uniref:GNAT family N-acetyltransferase n=1 Tax=Stenotrophomonas mori TaxID=2871096 RepID=A0ABT0SEW8_9GAMM|nr:GNAT family N-acetyltransferase [Stenotrophomonas mori]MCL7713676.1 GNAT family N-acetyltransferase [Stenotrophomonas mori]